MFLALSCWHAYCSGIPAVAGIPTFTDVYSVAGIPSLAVVPNIVVATSVFLKFPLLMAFILMKLFLMLMGFLLLLHGNPVVAGFSTFTSTFVVAGITTVADIIGLTVVSGIPFIVSIHAVLACCDTPAVFGGVVSINAVVGFPVAGAPIAGGLVYFCS